MKYLSSYLKQFNLINMVRFTIYIHYSYTYICICRRFSPIKSRLEYGPPSIIGIGNGPMHLGGVKPSLQGGLLPTVQSFYAAPSPDPSISPVPLIPLYIYIYIGINNHNIVIIENSQFTIFGFPVPSFSLCQDDFPGTLFISSVVMMHLVGVRSWILSGHELIHAVYECGIMSTANSCMPNRGYRISLAFHWFNPPVTSVTLPAVS